MSILVTGSMAYDYIMDFPDSFKDHILPDQLHILSVAFIVEQLRKNYGGTAGNISHTIKLLGGDPILFAPIGSDAEEYKMYLEQNGISTKYVEMSESLLSASAHITTDKDDNQITAFYPGALLETVGMSLDQVEESPALCIISPTQKEGMIKHAKEAKERNIPVVFDPGQQTTAFTPQEIQQMVGLATYVIANDYEMKLIEDKTGWDGKAMLEHTEVLITTLGEKGSVVTTREGVHTIGACIPTSVEDPTGAGDGYRGGFFTALAQGKDWKTCGQVGAVAACYAIEHYGTQNHTYTMEEFAARYLDAFGEPLSL